MEKVLSLLAYPVEKVWGAERLLQLKSNWYKGQPLPERIGESFEVSVLPEYEARVGEKLLSQVIDVKKIPYLVKFIDTQENLSIQVHPDDEYALKYEQTSGKNECWVILQAEEDAGIFLGFKEGVAANDFFNAAEIGEDVAKYLNFIPVKPGDFFFIPAGAVHAIGKGITLLEVQQSSGITYRVWDWNRVGLDGRPRVLHIQKSRDVLNFSPAFQHAIEQKKLEAIFRERAMTLLDSDNFVVRFMKVSASESLPIRPNPFERLSSIIILDGHGRIEGEQITSYASYLLPERGVELYAESETSLIIVE